MCGVYKKHSAEQITETLKALQLDIKTKQSKLPSIIDKDVINNIEKLSKI